MSHLSARLGLAELLTSTGKLQETDEVIPYSRSIDPPSQPTVMIRFDELDEGPARGLLKYRFTLVLLSSLTDRGPADDELEQLMLRVIDAIDVAHRVEDRGVQWVPPAKAGVYRGTTPSIQIQVNVTISKE